MHPQIQYSFEAKLWKSSTASWQFVSLPVDLTKEIRKLHQWEEEGWGRLKVMAQIDEIQWDTAIWYDTKQKTYLLPIKADIRRKLKIELGQTLEIQLYL